MLFFTHLIEKMRGRNAGEAFPFTSCGEAAELSRGHTTHIASSVPRSLPPPHQSLALYHLCVNFPAVINLSARLPERINELSLVQVLQCTRLEPPDWNPLLHQYQRSISRCEFAFLSISVKTIICGVPERKAGVVC